MSADELRDEIGRALRAAWPEFARAHPRLVPLLDPGVVLDAAADDFGDDLDYQDALADAAARGVGDQEMAMLIGRMTREWLQLLVRGGPFVG